MLRDIESKNFLNEDNYSESKETNESILIRILVKKELCGFCK